MQQEFSSDDKPILLTSVAKSSKTKETIRGSDMFVKKDKTMDLTIETYKRPLFSIGYRMLRFFKKFNFKIREKLEGIRIEAMLTGEMKGTLRDENFSFKAGQYRLTDSPDFTALFKKNTACCYFLTHYSQELLDQIGISEFVNPTQVKPLTQEMTRLIQKILHNPYQEKLMQFHYDNCIRELLKLHLTHPGDPLPGEMSDNDLKAIHTADTLLQRDLTQHDDIPTLAARAGTNEFKLKRGFRKAFDMSVFERLTFHRMEHAKVLLLNTNRTVDDIAGKVGYSSRNSFITAFKKLYATTPRKWRQRELFS